MVVPNVLAGQCPTWSSWVNIPTTSNGVSFSLQVRWFDAANAIVSTSLIKRYTDDTASTWNLAATTLLAPPGTVRAQVQLVAIGLKSTIYVDNIVLRR